MDSAKIIQALTREEILEISGFTKNKSIHYVSNGVNLELINNKYKLGSTIIVSRTIDGKPSAKASIRAILTTSDLAICM